MLVEIYSEKFKIGNTIRKPIQLKPGLNVVLGGTEADNSIGKSTFLLVIDFCFGGLYYTKCGVIDEIKNHSICFTFMFNNQYYYFMRKTDEPNVVYYCEERYTNPKPNSLDDFRKFLNKNYNLSQNGFNISDTTARFFRIFDKDNYTLNLPLHVVPQEKHEIAINSLLKLFNLYQDIYDLKDKYKQAKEKKETFNKARNLELVPYTITTKTQVKENKERISELQKQLQELTQQEDEKLLAMEVERNSLGSGINSEITKLRRYKYSLNAKIKELTSSSAIPDKKFDYNLSQLHDYFPDVNLQEITKVQSFHITISDILSNEIQNEIDRLNGLIKQADLQIDELKKDLKNLGIPEKVSKAFLDKCFEIQRKINILEAQNNAYDEKKKYADDAAITKQTLLESLDSHLRKIEKDINDRLKILNAYIYNENRTTPTIDLKEGESYSYNTPVDRGTGSIYKSLLIFDIALLQLTQLPTLAHDSLLFKNIGDEPMSKIIELYKETDKQIFISFDKLDSYKNTVISSINQNTILKLGKKENSLYGYYFGDNQGE